MTTPALGWFPSVLSQAGREFLLLTLKVLPFFVIGAATGAVVQAWLPARWTQRLFGGAGRRSVYAAVAAGALLPGCSCATMPMAAGMQASTPARLGTVMAFIFVSPLLSPVTVALTWGMLGWRMTAARVIASLVGSVALGLFGNRFEWWLAEGGAPSPASGVDGPLARAGEVCLATTDASETGGPGPRFWSAFARILRRITPYFLLGMVIAAVLAAALPEAAIPRLLGGSSGAWAYLLAALVGIPLYVCEGEEVPITFALLRAGLGNGPSLTFLLGSVGTCVPTILMARRLLGQRATACYVGFWLAFAIVAGSLFQLAA